ncbi:glycosyl hydrolases family 31-domain-containing protein [Chytridium lagenaria]|nr:glycosyl hydrolases family 31-domain-containing protein [Chytridium lagenaria]
MMGSSSRVSHGVRRYAAIALILLACLSISVYAANHDDFRVCRQTGYCVRQRAFSRLVDKGRLEQPSYVVKSLLSDGLRSSNLTRVGPTNGRIRAEVVEPSRPNIIFILEVDFLAVGPVRIRMFEKDPMVPRFELNGDLCLASEPQLTQDTVNVKDTKVALLLELDRLVVRVNKSPFSISVLKDGEEVVVFNGQQYLNFEHYRKKEDDPPITVDFPVDWDLDFENEEEEIQMMKKYLNYGKWAEEFRGYIDSKPYGPASIGFDVTFPMVNYLYGLPEHAASFALKTTRVSNGKFKEDPYRLYNLDVFSYEIDSLMALYGSVPFVLGHGSHNSHKKHSVGVLWLNSGEQWVDIEEAYPENKKTLQFQEKDDFVIEKKSADGGKRLHWMTESGIIDLFVIVADKPSLVTTELTSITGRPYLPPLFAMGYHQCRWNYNDQKDTESVNKGFDDYNIPYDVLWLDIEHTDGKKYFTWDYKKWPNPLGLQDTLASKGRKLVTIVDPHIKRDQEYSVYREFNEKDLWIKNSIGQPFEGACWPGSSYWIDFVNPESRRIWATQFALDKYPSSSRNLFTWNDMNEPSVFSGPEVTVPKDSRHVYGWEHRDVHNLYGALQQRSSFEGQLLRSNNADRPFVLSRSFHTGSQRFGAVWTGDNNATWSHLKATVPILLSLSVSGLTFVGADVSGFFNNPEPELFVRWYQTASFQPFFRGHAQMNTRRREPWLMGEPYTSLIRAAIRRRYQLLPYIYTVFYETHIKGTLVMRPLFYEFSEDEATFGTEEAFMLGGSILVHPVVQKIPAVTKVYLPHAAIWYDYNTFEAVPSGYRTFQSDLSWFPIFIRGGSIVIRQENVHTSTQASKKEPYTVLIAVDSQDEASGYLYVDDGTTFNIGSSGFLSTNLVYANGTSHCPWCSRT